VQTEERQIMSAAILRRTASGLRLTSAAELASSAGRITFSLQLEVSLTVEAEAKNDGKLAMWPPDKILARSKDD
jgi:hypothetical protein